MLEFKLERHNIREVVLRGDGVKDKVFKQIFEDNKNVFVSKAGKNALKEYSKDKSEINAKRFWKELLIDSICLLKMNDGREKLSDDVSKIYNERDLHGFNSLFDKVRRESSYGIDELGKYFDDFIEFESVLYGTGEFYRDHVHHVLEVWGVGIGLLEGLQRIDLKLNDGFIMSRQDFHYQITENAAKSISRSEMWAMWSMIALCHDLGYPLEKASQINQKVRKIVNHFGTLNFNELNYNFDLLNSFLVAKYLNIISSKAERGDDRCVEESLCEEKECGSGKSHHTEIQPKYYDKLCKSLEDYQHGVLSGMLIFKKLTYFLETDYSNVKKSLSCEDLRQFYIRKEILRSICGHTCPKIYHIDLNTLSFLLIFCDELQEWGRPRFYDLLYQRNGDVQSVEIQEFSTIIEEGNVGTDIKVLSEFDLEVNLEASKKILEGIAKRKYKTLHYLLRGAKDDAVRRVKLKWQMKIKDVVAVFEFDSSMSSDEMYRSYWLEYRDGNPSEAGDLPLYS